MTLLRLALLLLRLSPARVAALGGTRTLAIRADGYQYSYAHHGADWSMGECGSRERQSPIDFGGAAPWTCSAGQGSIWSGCNQQTFYFQYSPVSGEVKLSNRWHSLLADLSGQGYGGITYNDQHFDVVSVDIRAGSEHTFHGRRLPLELHIAHRTYDSSHVLMVAVPFDTPGATFAPVTQAATPAGMAGSEEMEADAERDDGDAGPEAGGFSAAVHWVPAGALDLLDLGASGKAEQPLEGAMDWDSPDDSIPSLGAAPAPAVATPRDTLEALFHSGPLPKGGETSQLEIEDPADLLSPLLAGGTFFEYQGSLTEPPCTETVTWLVRRDPLKVMPAQSAALRDAISRANGGFENWRAPMPQMKRSIFVRVAVAGMPPLGLDKEATAKHSTGNHAGEVGALGTPALEAIVPAQQAAIWAREAESVARKVGETRAAAVAAMPLLEPSDAEPPPPIPSLKVESPPDVLDAATSLTLKPRDAATETLPQKQLRRVPQELPEEAAMSQPPQPPPPQQQQAQQLSPDVLEGNPMPRVQRVVGNRRAQAIDGVRHFPPRQSGRKEIDGIKFFPRRAA